MKTLLNNWILQNINFVKIIILTFSSLIILNSKGQNVIIIDTLVIDSTYSFHSNSNKYGFVNYNGSFNHPVSNNVLDINEMVSFNSDSLKLRISHACGCGETTFKLISDGKKYYHKSGNNHYKVFLDIKDDDHCKASCYMNLAFYIGNIHFDKSIEYIQFDNKEDLIFVGQH